jgi:hypothetical protein
MDNLNLLRRMPMMPPLNPRTAAMNRIIPMAPNTLESLSLSGRSR